MRTFRRREAPSECDSSLLEETFNSVYSNPGTADGQSSPALACARDERDFGSRIDGIQHLSRDLDALRERI